MALPWWSLDMVTPILFKWLKNHIANYDHKRETGMFLNYVALGLLVVVASLLLYGAFAIYDLPYNIARRRNHPHQDAIYAAGCVSVFTLHLIWPLLWIWAQLYPLQRGGGFAPLSSLHSGLVSDQLAELQQQSALLQQKIADMEAALGREREE